MIFLGIYLDLLFLTLLLHAASSLTNTSDCKNSTHLLFWITHKRKHATRDMLLTPASPISGLRVLEHGEVQARAACLGLVEVMVRGEQRCYSAAQHGCRLSWMSCVYLKVMFDKGGFWEALAEDALQVLPVPGFSKPVPLWNRALPGILQDWEHSIRVEGEVLSLRVCLFISSLFVLDQSA